MTKVALELIVNVLILAFSVFCFFYVGATMPVSAVDELGAEQWPQGLLVILMIALCWNIFKYFKNNPRQEIAAAFGSLGTQTINFFRGKLFFGMVMVMTMALMYEPIGFMVTSVVFLVAYGILLGERRPLILIGSALVITLILYIGFAVLLGVMLPRGQVPFLRDFALFVESLVPRI